MICTLCNATINNQGCPYCITVRPWDGKVANYVAPVQALVGYLPHRIPCATETPRLCSQWFWVFSSHKPLMKLLPFPVDTIPGIMVLVNVFYRGMDSGYPPINSIKDSSITAAERSNLSTHTIFLYPLMSLWIWSRSCAHYVIVNISNLQIILTQIVGRCFI